MRGCWGAKRTRQRGANTSILIGLFAADIVVGDWAAKNYCFVELEDATEDSIFSTVRGRRTTKWSERFEEGCSQIVDWLWLLEANSAGARRLPPA